MTEGYLNSEKPTVQTIRKRYKGILMFANEVEEVENMKTRDDDIWICGYPRTGTTLLTEMTYLVQTLDYETANTVLLEERISCPDFKDDRFPHMKGLKQVEDMKPPRLIKSHLHHFLLPEQLQRGKGRIIYIARNPKDVVTSFYRMMYWADLLTEEDRNFNDFVQGFIDGTEFACPWTQHVLEFWERRNERQVLFLEFENVIKDRPAAIRRIADFLERTLTDEDVNRIADHCEIEKMRVNPNVNRMHWTKFRKMNFDCGSRFINKGKPGIWREALTQDQSNIIDEMIKEVAKSGLIIEQT